MPPRSGAPAGLGSEPPRSTRRTLLRGAGLIAVLGGGALGGTELWRRVRPDVDPRTEAPLLSRTVAIDGERVRRLVGPDSTDLVVAPGTRLLPSALGTSLEGEAKEFLDGAAAWIEQLDPALQEPAQAALWDLWVLSVDLPAPVAGWSRSWRYIWPRDAAFCAVALARVGHGERALEILEHLQQLQRPGRWFEARYSATEGTAPDDRPAQFDGTGWALWAAGEVIGAPDAPQAEQARERLDSLLSASHDLLLEQTDQGRSLPPVSPDYWEVRERRVTLGIMAATRAGLRAAAALSGAQRDAAAADAFDAQLLERFGERGWQRYSGSGGADSALALLVATGGQDLVPAQQVLDLREQLARPAGGIAPGARWKRDGISWTPSTSLLALALARSGRPEVAGTMLDWLLRHRTEDGSLPEKVLHDGSPAAVAPLSWTAANVLLTMDALR